jgi:hypothetical protein
MKARGVSQGVLQKPLQRNQKMFCKRRFLCGRAYHPQAWVCAEDVALLFFPFPCEFRFENSSGVARVDSDAGRNEFAS